MGRSSIRPRGKPGIANMTISPECLTAALILPGHTFPAPVATVNPDPAALSEVNCPSRNGPNHDNRGRQS
jgi:hypothetical protein